MKFRIRCQFDSCCTTRGCSLLDSEEDSKTVRMLPCIHMHHALNTGCRTASEEARSKDGHGRRRRKMWSMQIPIDICPGPCRCPSSPCQPHHLFTWLQRLIMPTGLLNIFNTLPCTQTITGEQYFYNCCLFISNFSLMWMSSCLFGLCILSMK